MSVNQSRSAAHEASSCDDEVMVGKKGLAGLVGVGSKTGISSPSSIRAGAIASTAISSGSIGAVVVVASGGTGAG